MTAAATDSQATRASAPVSEEIRGDIDVGRILSEIAGLPEWDQQIAVQQTEAGDDPGLGWDLKYPEREYVREAFDLPYLNSLLQELRMYRTRLIRMRPTRCFTWHRDETRRIHIPVKINPGSFLVVDDRVVRFELGRAYLVDTTRDHTAVNASPVADRQDRIHIVGCADREFSVVRAPDGSAAVAGSNHTPRR